MVASEEYRSSEYGSFDREPISESVKSSTIGDQPSAEDRFGFAPYVNAVSRFLANGDTSPPLTISIEGEWGSGKSSFMLQLEKSLAVEIAKENKQAKFVRFSPWLHDKQESMWAAFALECARQLAASLPLEKRWQAHWQLAKQRFDWKAAFGNIRVILPLIVCLVVIPLMFFMFPPEQLEWAVNARPFVKSLAIPLTGFGASLAALILVARGIMVHGGMFFRRNIELYLRKPNYAEQVAFLERFNQDFSKIVSAYAGDSNIAGDNKVFIFVDDLDRCEIPTAADLMQAINLLIGTSPQLIFILGMDRSKVAAGLAVKHESLLPFLRIGNRQGKSETETRHRDGLDFGYAFIEKFVQVSFRLPTPTDRDIDRFLDGLQLAANEEAAVPDNENEPEHTAVDEHDWGQFVLEGEKDSETVRDVLKMVAPALDNNPRRLIQFINTFRLKAYVAYRTGLFNQEENPLTFPQLGKFVAIGLKWPTLLLELDARRDLFREIEAVTLSKRGSSYSSVRTWVEDKPLMALFEYGTEDKYRLGQLNVDALLAVSPAVERPGDIEDSTMPQTDSPPSRELPEANTDVESNPSESSTPVPPDTKKKAKRKSATKKATPKAVSRRAVKQSTKKKATSKMPPTESAPQKEPKTKRTLKKKR